MSVKFGQCLKCAKPCGPVRAYCEEHQQQFDLLLAQGMQNTYPLLYVDPARNEFDIDSMRICGEIDRPQPPNHSAAVVKTSAYSTCLKIRNWFDGMTMWPFRNEERFTWCWIWFALGLLAIGILEHVGVWQGWWTP